MSQEGITARHNDIIVEDKNIPDDTPVTDFKNVDGKDRVGLALLEQTTVIPTTGKRIPTTKLEYWSFCVFYFTNIGTGLNQDGAAIRQALLTQEFPKGTMHWGGQVLTTTSMLLDVTGIMFACQVLVLVAIGPYADYGKWRPWILIISQSLVMLVMFVMCAFTKPSQWAAAQVLFNIGSLASNVVTAFYGATFTGLVRDLPKMIESEQQVAQGLKTPEEHAQLDALERSKLFNFCNITGSAINVVLAGVAVGIAAGIGFTPKSRLNYSYRVLLGFFGASTFLTTVPFLIIGKHRPGQQLPAGASLFTAGPKQLWQAGKNVRYLKHTFIYLVAYFLLTEVVGTYHNLAGILRNTVFDYSPVEVNAYSLVADLAGGLGTLTAYFLQSRYKWSIKTCLWIGAWSQVLPQFWGMIGCYTTRIGFHHAWEFWFQGAWFYFNAFWGAYSVTMITEVIPAPKQMMFFALFNCVGKTSGFIGPFISSAIISRAGGNTNYAFWFLIALGLTGMIVFWFVDPDQAKIDNAAFLEREADVLYTAEQKRQSETAAAVATVSALQTA